MFFILKIYIYSQMGYLCLLKEVFINEFLFYFIKRELDCFFVLKKFLGVHNLYDL